MKNVLAALFAVVVLGCFAPASFAMEPPPDGNLGAQEAATAPALEAVPEGALGIGNQIFIPAAAFTSDGVQPDSFFFPFGGGYFQGSAAGYGCLVAPVIFPKGSRNIGKVVAYVYDDDAGIDIFPTLRRTSLNGAGQDVVATASTNGATAAVQRLVMPVTDSRILKFRSYTLTLCLQATNHRLYGVMVTYR